MPVPNISEMVQLRLSKCNISTHKPRPTTHILVYEYLGLSELCFCKLFNLNRSSPITDLWKFSIRNRGC